MPIAYSIDKSAGIIRETWTGQVSAADLAAHWMRLLTDSEALTIRKTLVDLRGCSIDFSGEQLFELIREVAEPMLRGRDWRSALVVAKPLHYGVSRQYQSLAHVYSKDAIFHDSSAALDWLRQ
ncbi:MAG: hypothetical protein ACJ8OJ_00830 [Povalibacter sp.]